MSRSEHAIAEMMDFVMRDIEKFKDGITYSELYHDFCGFMSKKDLDTLLAVLEAGNVIESNVVRMTTYRVKPRRSR